MEKSESQTASSRIRVVIADDHPVVRTGIRMLLERSDDIVVVGEAGDGHEALHLSETLTPDVLLLDLAMPGLNGIEVARALQSARSPVRVLVLSAYDDDQYIYGLLNSGAAGYLTKEEAMTTIDEAIRGIASGKDGWLSRRITEKLVQRVVSRGQQERDITALTEREIVVARLVAQGWGNQQIAEELQLSERTVRFHLQHIYEKLDFNTRSELIVWALRAKIDQL
jgi:DNA-binding NarL/FixJ family response regulator